MRVPGRLLVTAAIATAAIHAVRAQNVDLSTVPKLTLTEATLK